MSNQLVVPVHAPQETKARIPSLAPLSAPITCSHAALVSGSACLRRSCLCLFYCLFFVCISCNGSADPFSGTTKKAESLPSHTTTPIPLFCMSVSLVRTSGKTSFSVSSASVLSLSMSLARRSGVVRSRILFTARDCSFYFRAATRFGCILLLLLSLSPPCKNLLVALRHTHDRTVGRS